MEYTQNNYVLNVYKGVQDARLQKAVLCLLWHWIYLHNVWILFK